MSELIPLVQAAAEFQVDRATIYRYLRAGQLKRYKRAMDRKTYVDRQEIRRLLTPRLVKGAKGDGHSTQSR